MKWPGSVFSSEGTKWICGICGCQANARSGPCLRQAVRHYHTVERCAAGVLKFKFGDSRAQATRNAEIQGKDYHKLFLDRLNGEPPRSTVIVAIPPHVPEGESRSRSRSPTFLSRKQPVEDDIDEFIGKRVAKHFGKSVFFGTVAEKIRGAVIAKEVGTSTGFLQVVWKIVYDDADDEEMNRKEIIAALNTYRLHSYLDFIGSNKERGLPVLAGYADDEPIEEFHIAGVFGSATTFLDPRYRLLDMLTPNATQNRLSYLVELLLDKYRKGISNEALKTRLRKDSAAFGALEMPTDARCIGRFLGSRKLVEVTRHRCSNDECSYAWIGSVHPSKFDANDCCPDCGTQRYIRKGGTLVPRRCYYYFGAVRAIEALHRHPVFRANWKKNIDLSMNDYRCSPDAQRLNDATEGEALAEMNGLYISMADGFQSHKSKTQSITGIFLF